jgi:uncharacterized protein (DUF433 family)
MGFARSALPPSAAIVKAPRHTDWAPCGNVSNSFSAALIHEMGRVAGVICRHCFTPRAYVVIFDNEGQAVPRLLIVGTRFPDKVSGAWVFRDTRLPVATVIENLEDLSVEEVMEQFDVTREQITAVLDFVAQSLRVSVPGQPSVAADAHSL